MSQETLSEKLQELAGYSMSPGQISRVENRESPYGQDFLEALAVVFQCDVPDIVGRDPNVPEAPRSILDTLKPQSRKLIDRMIEIYAAEEADDQGTGTEG